MTQRLWDKSSDILTGWYFLKKIQHHNHKETCMHISLFYHLGYCNSFLANHLSIFLFFAQLSFFFVPKKATRIIYNFETTPLFPVTAYVLFKEQDTFVKCPVRIVIHQSTVISLTRVLFAISLYFLSSLDRWPLLRFTQHGLL